MRQRTYPGTNSRAGTPRDPTQPDKAAAVADAATAQRKDQVQINIIDVAGDYSTTPAAAAAAAAAANNDAGQ